ncbi:MAG TPA: ribonuclease Y, partial [Patescibacteria group bacterium]
MAILGKILKKEDETAKKQNQRSRSPSRGNLPQQSYSPGPNQPRSSYRPGYQSQASQAPASTNLGRDVLEVEKKIAENERLLAQRSNNLDQREKELDRQAKTLDDRIDQVNQIRNDLISKLEKVSSLTKDEARKLILENLEKNLTDEIAKRLKEAEEKIRVEADEKAKEIILEAMTHGITDWVAEYTQSIITLPNEEIKGRIIGKEGRNIRVFELATGVELILDPETPNEVRLSSFDPLRREISRIALERLIKDGRIQPTRIEEFVDRAKQDLNRELIEVGKRAAGEAGFFNFDTETLTLIGRLKYRTSYGQNQLIAVLETSKIAGKIAADLGADVNVCKMGGLLHDIGKVIEGEGTHVQLGVEYLKKKNFPSKVIDCVAQHHEDEPFSSKESVIVHLADAISGSRPGARQESYEDYVKRLTEIENVAKKFGGIRDAYAILAGRELRIIVDPQTID